MDGGKRVWVPHDLDGFKMGRIVDIGAEGITVEPFNEPGKVRSLLHAFCNYLFISFPVAKHPVICTQFGKRTLSVHKRLTFKFCCMYITWVCTGLDKLRLAM